MEAPLYTVAAHLGAAALMETQHFFSKGHSIFLCTKDDAKWQMRLLSQSGS